MSRIVNPYNFLRWNDLDLGPADSTSDIGNAYLRDAARCDYRPVVKHGEPMRFYINAELGTPWIVDSDFKLRLVNARTGAVVNSNLAVVNKNNFTNTAGVASFNFYSEVTITDAVAEGDYYFEIYGAIRPWLRSNAIQVVSVSNAILVTTNLVTFRNDTYFYGIRYNDLSTFTHQYRLHLNLIEAQEESSIEVYAEVTTGKRRTYNNKLDLVKTVEAYYFDQAAHQAAIVMFAHSSLVINGRTYIKKDAYKESPNPLYKHTKGSINLYDQGFASVNRCS